MNTYIAERGAGPHNHRFGGTGWTTSAPVGASPVPALILTLDFGDPRLGADFYSGEVPLCSRVDGDSLERQRYQFDSTRRLAEFSGEAWSSTLDPADVMTTPFPESPLRLRGAEGDEIVDAESPYEAQDTFLGGAAFLRVLGSPLWIANAEQVNCDCGKPMRFVASVGYENYSGPSGLLAEDEPFFLGELALYFFVCFQCAAVEVVSQAG